MTSYERNPGKEEQDIAITYIYKSEHTPEATQIMNKL